MISDGVHIGLLCKGPQVFQLVDHGMDTHAGSSAKECTLDPCTAPYKDPSLCSKTAASQKTLTKE